MRMARSDSGNRVERNDKIRKSLPLNESMISQSSFSEFDVFLGGGTKAGVADAGDTSPQGLKFSLMCNTWPKTIPT